MKKERVSDLYFCFSLRYFEHMCNRLTVFRNQWLPQNTNVY